MICHSQINAMEYFAIANSLCGLYAPDQNASLNILTGCKSIYSITALLYFAALLCSRSICHKTDLLNFFEQNKLRLYLTVFCLLIRFEFYLNLPVEMKYSSNFYLCRPHLHINHQQKRWTNVILHINILFGS